MLSPNGSSATCIADCVFHIPMPCFHGAIPVYPKVLPHSSKLLHGAAYTRTTMPYLTACRASELSVRVSPAYFPLSLSSLSGSPVFRMKDSNEMM